jgi:hypothetical protein
MFGNNGVAIGEANEVHVAAYGERLARRLSDIDAIALRSTSGDSMSFSSN